MTFDDKYWEARNRADWNARNGGPREYGSAGTNDGWASGSQAKTERDRAAATARAIADYRPPTPQRFVPISSTPSAPRSPFTATAANRQRSNFHVATRHYHTTPRRSLAWRLWRFVTAPFRWCWALVVLVFRAAFWLVKLALALTAIAVVVGILQAVLFN